MPTQDQYLAPILYIDKATRERDTAVITRGLTGIDLTNIYLTFVNIVAGLGGGGSNTYTSISVATAAAGGLTNGGNYAVADIEGISGAIYYATALPDGTLSLTGMVTNAGQTYFASYDPSVDATLHLKEVYSGNEFLNSNSGTPLAITIVFSAITGFNTHSNECIIGGLNYSGFTYTAPAGAVVKWINLTISETTTLDLSSLSVDKTLSGVMQAGTITVPSHCGDDLTTFNFPAYFSNSHLKEDKLIIFSALGTQRSTMYYDGTYKITGLEYGSCDYDPVTFAIKNSTLEVDLGTLAAAATTIDLSGVNFAGTVRVTQDAGGNTITDITNGTDGETYAIESMDSIPQLAFDGGGNIIPSLPILASTGGLPYGFSQYSKSYFRVNTKLGGVIFTTTDTQ